MFILQSLDMELVDLIKHPKVENVRLLDSNCRISSQVNLSDPGLIGQPIRQRGTDLGTRFFNIRIKGILMTTPHHFTYLSNSEEIQILHKSVDLAEKDFDRGRIQVKN